MGHHDFPKPKTVFVYARSRGLFAGVLIDGAKLYARNSVNRALYGKNAR
ncbi:MAG TPA: YSC84-related protein [Blastocatellia bacterium]|nr:YSC84-related protein [Blastocatellia bacterium]